MRYVTVAGMLVATNVSAGAAHALPSEAAARTDDLDGTRLASPPHLGDPAVRLHTVESGDTLRSIADRYGVSAQTILAANAIDDPDVLHVGQQLAVPAVDGVLHTVQPGESLAGIAEQYAVGVPALVSANALEAPDLLAVGTLLVIPGVTPAAPSPSAQNAATVDAGQAPARASGRYTVQAGDTLRSVAEAFNIDILTLIAINGLSDPDLISPGSTLRIASSDTVEHVVEPGETLGDLAWRYAVDSAALLAVNGLVDADRIVVGTTLVVPLDAAAAPPRPASAPAAAAPSAPAAAAAPPPSVPAPAPGRGTSPAPAGNARPAAPSAPAAAPAAAARAPRVTTARVTGYALGAGAVSSRTASGTTTHWGTVAADIHLFPFGTRVRIEGLGDTVFTVEDTGSAVRGNVFDVWFADAAAARALGARTRQITVLGPGE